MLEYHFKIMERLSNYFTHITELYREYGNEEQYVTHALAEGLHKYPWQAEITYKIMCTLLK